jgi:hypothetical protein
MFITKEQILNGIKSRESQIRVVLLDASAGLG